MFYLLFADAENALGPLLQFEKQLDAATHFPESGHSQMPRMSFSASPC
jgi:hypothetical protein